MSTPIYRPKVNKVMNVIVFASGGGGNLNAAIQLSKNKPHLLKVGLVVTDRLGIPAIDIAKKNNIKVLAYDFEKECGIWAVCKKNVTHAKKYKKAAEIFHNKVLTDIQKIESSTKEKFDLVVLSYHRWVHGKLFKYFEGKMINQHAGDLTVMTENNSILRKFVGINPVLMALKDGQTQTRTTTFLVRNNHDGGEILCQGPWVKFCGPKRITKNSAWQHEVVQKKESDWPSLTFALTEIALGNYSVTKNKYPDGCYVIAHKNKPLPYSGINLENYQFLTINNGKTN
jgi:phosphoribosylglycinamide formyltransferase-1